ncbi:putative disease resistance protein RGA4 [Chenopodium quinoa]|uniref:Uncharacterized protein n=1 Tax=Chenopodium quinoa TaxID=63459 RepID=A0A803M6C3_CHEQI|nr:putative disease resistance protein RGA4 [Chenopodium quinoa]
MDIGTILSAAQTLFAALDCSELKDICSIFGYKSQLNDLQNTVHTIKTVLSKAEAKQELLDEEQHYVEELKDAVYEADDLLDEFITLIEQKKITDNDKKVRLFTFFKKVGVAHKVSRGVKKIKQKLDAAVYNNQFRFQIDHEPIRKRRPETCSYVYAVDIIGREDDLDIVKMLLDSNVQQELSFITIVGIGGLGKTALAQLVYNDERILASATGLKNEGSTPESVQNQLRELLASNKYLLVLDDVWTEHSFGSEKLNHSEDLVKIGQEIVERCARNPLAIRVVGSFLFGQDESKWQSFLDIGLANFRESHDDITPILLLSYHHLESPIKCCFSYSALFPKDFEIGKEMLISLWMAQGYIVPFDKGQSIEDAGEEYFSILLRRCFFQDVKKNEDGEINSCKIHDLMHDIAQKVTQGEISAKTVSIDDLDKKVRHLSFDRSSFANYSFINTHIRSFLNVDDNFQFVNMEQLLPAKALVASCKCLRALDLSGLNIKSLPSSMGNLLHLRYLDLSFNGKLDELPKSITKLYTLQTLKLRECFLLEEFPKHLSRLVNLRILDTWGCYSLTFMPRGMGKLTYLHTLSKFIVGGVGSGSSWEQWCDGMEDLKALDNLKNDLEIHIKWPLKGTNAVKQEGSGRSVVNVLRNKKHVKHIRFNFIHEEANGRVVIDEEARLRLMEELQPHSKLKGLEMLGYHGVKLPDWAIDNNMVKSLPYLVKLHLEDCKDLEQVPRLGKLQNLKVLSLLSVDNVAWLNSLPVEAFQCLSEMRIKYDKVVESLAELGVVLHSCSSSLRSLIIHDCHKLKTLYGGLEHLTALEKLRISASHNLRLSEVTQNSTGTPWPSLHQSLRYLHLWDMPQLINLPNSMQYLTALHTLEISTCKQLESLPLWISQLTSLKQLRISGCSASLERRCQSIPIGKDWPNIKHIPTIVVRKALDS